MTFLPRRRLLWLATLAVSWPAFAASASSAAGLPLPASASSAAVPASSAAVPALASATSPRALPSSPAVDRLASSLPGAGRRAATPLQVAASSPADMQRMTKMLDELDHQEFEDQLARARSLIRKRDLAKAADALEKAKRLRHTQDDRDEYQAVYQALVDEGDRIEQEQELARQEKAEEERLQREQEELERQERLAREADEAREREETRQYIANSIMDGINRIGQAYEESARIQQQANALVAQAQREKQEAADREYERKRAEQQAAYERAQEAAAERRRAYEVAQAQQAEARTRQEEALRAQREAAEQKAAAAAQERQQQEEKRQQELARQEAAEERKRKEAEAAAAKRAAEEAEKRADQEYLQQLTEGTQLYAIRCPDGGEHKYYVVGKLPRISPRRVSCVDVEYTATCPGSAVRYTGRGFNFTGISTDCFSGDVYTIPTTPACPVEQVKVHADAIVNCDLSKQR